MKKSNRRGNVRCASGPAVDKVSRLYQHAEMCPATATHESSTNSNVNAGIRKVEVHA